LQHRCLAWLVHGLSQAATPLITVLCKPCAEGVCLLPWSRRPGCRRLIIRPLIRC